jgi:hypothetical protein
MMREPLAICKPASRRTVKRFTVKTVESSGRC